MSISISIARAQYHLRQSFVFLDVHTLNHPEVMAPFAGDRIDAEERPTDPGVGNDRRSVKGRWRCDRDDHLKPMRNGFYMKAST